MLRRFNNIRLLPTVCWFTILWFPFSVHRRNILQTVHIFLPVNIHAFRNELIEKLVWPVRRNRSWRHFPSLLDARSCRNGFLVEFSMPLIRLIDSALRILIASDLMTVKLNYFDLSYSNASDVTEECRNYFPRTKIKQKKKNRRSISSTHNNVESHHLQN